MDEERTQLISEIIDLLDILGFVSERDVTNPTDPAD